MTCNLNLTLSLYKDFSITISINTLNNNFSAFTSKAHELQSYHPINTNFKVLKIKVEYGCCKSNGFRRQSASRR